jgi:hypothetical protein
MARRFAFLSLCLFACAGSVLAEPPFRFPEGRHAHGELRYVNGVPVLIVEGTPEEMGEAVGALAVKPGQRVLDYPADLFKHFYAGTLMAPFVTAGKKMAQHFPDDYQRELDAMARGAGVDRNRLIVGNTLFDLKKLFACSALLVDGERSATGRPLLARNLDYPALGYVHDYSLVTAYRPRNAGHAFATVGFPGLLGCLSGMNDAGLALAVLEVFQVKGTKQWFDPSGLPYALCYRRLLEECATINEAKAMLEKMKRVSTTNLVLADKQGIAVLEVTPQHVLVRRPEQDVCICTNHYCTPELKPFVPLNMFRTRQRFETLRQATVFIDSFGPRQLQRALHAVYIEDETLQTMIFEPASLRLHLAIGQCPSSAAPLRVLDLEPPLTSGRRP